MVTKRSLSVFLGVSIIVMVGSSYCYTRHLLDSNCADNSITVPTGDLNACMTQFGSHPDD